MSSSPLEPTPLHFVEEFASPVGRSTCSGANLTIQSWPGYKTGPSKLQSSCWLLPAREGVQAGGSWSESALGPAVQLAPGSCGCRWRCPRVHLLTAPLTTHNPTLTSCRLATASRPLWNACLSKPRRHHDVMWGERSVLRNRISGQPHTCRGNGGMERGGGRRGRRGWRGREEGKGLPGALSESRSVMSALCDPRGLYSTWDSPGQNTGMGSHSLLQGSPNPGIEPGSPALQVDSFPAEPQGRPKNTGVGSLSLLQRIFPTQGSNPGLLHCSRILY